MPRLTNAVSGVTVSASDETAALLGGDWVAEGGTQGSSTSGYDGMKVADLKDEIDRRNEGRDEADLIPADGKKADLIAALEADDAASTGQ